jgi:hypothetical protein
MVTTGPEGVLLSVPISHAHVAGWEGRYAVVSFRSFNGLALDVCEHGPSQTGDGGS